MKRERRLPTGRPARYWRSIFREKTVNVLDMLKYGNLAFEAAYENIPAEHWEVAGVTGFWSTKDIVAHLTSWELVLGDVLTTFAGGGPTPHLDELSRVNKGYNDSEVEKRQGMTPAEVVAEYQAAHERVMNLVPQVPSETYRENGTLPWYGSGYCLDDFIVYINYAHKREHAAEINVYRDRLKQSR